jgi:phage terminase large subunit
VKIGTTDNLLYHDKNVKLGTTYTYTVRANGRNVTSAYYSGWKRQYTPGTPAVNSITSSTNAITLKWGWVTGAEGYRVYGLGEWGLLGGQFFNGWKQSLHVVKPFKIPDSWIKFRCMDWGSYRPYACLWVAVDYDGNLYIYRELYGYGGKPNVGTKESSRVVAQKVASAEAHEKKQIVYGVLDNACWNKVDTGAPSIAEEINRVLMENGCMPFNPCTKGREQAAEEIRLRLEGHIDNEGRQKPALFVFENCFHTIRTLPELTHDKNKPETYDTNGEDHICDALGYGCMSRPYAPQQPKKKEAWELDRWADKPKSSAWGV